MFKPIPINPLRQPHPEQERIDAESARLLRATARPPSDILSWGTGPAAPLPRPEKKTSP